MPYVLGIDLGGTRTTAAVSRWEGTGWARPEIVQLSADAYHVPSVLRLTPDGALVVGDPALGPPVGAGPDGYPPPDTSPVARGFTRRIGDDVPVAVGGEVWTAEALTAVLAMWVVERVMAGERGTAPEQIVISHPAGWGAHRREVLRRALWEIGLARVTLLPEPVTAAESHACRGFPGRTLAVYSLGEEEFGAAVVGRTPVGFELLGQLGGGEPLGTADFDEALVRHVLDQLRDREQRRERQPREQQPAAAAQPAGPGRRERARAARPAPWSDRAARMALPGLARLCAEAGQRLTTGTETDVRLHLPEGPIRVPVTRAGFEEMIGPALRLTVTTLVRAVHAAGLRPDQVDGVLLVGVGARIPLVAELIAGRLPGPVTVEAEPADTVAAGAAWAAARIVSPSGPDGGDHLRIGQPWSEGSAGQPWSEGSTGQPWSEGSTGQPWSEGSTGASGGSPPAPEWPAPRVPAARPAFPAYAPEQPPARPPVRVTPLTLPRARTTRLSLAGGGTRSTRARTRT